MPDWFITQKFTKFRAKLQKNPKKNSEKSSVKISSEKFLPLRYCL